MGRGCSWRLVGVSASVSTSVSASVLESVLSKDASVLGW
jgi:hypothetical protein